MLLAFCGCLATSQLGSWAFAHPGHLLVWLGLLGVPCGGFFWFRMGLVKTPDLQAVATEHFELLGLDRLIRAHLHPLHLHTPTREFQMEQFCWVGTHMQCVDGMQVSLYWLTDTLELICVQGQLNTDALKESFTLEVCSETRKQQVLAGHPQVHQHLFEEVSG